MGGSGGGAGGPAANTVYNAGPSAPGIGITSSITGTAVEYGKGGSSGSVGTAGAANTGNGGRNDTAGGSGLVAIRYEI